MAADTAQDVRDLINSEIDDNGNNEITAAVLRPVLLAMVDQTNDLIGDPTEIAADTVIDEINDVAENQPSGVTIYTGTADPNVTPPPSFDIGDFYQQTLASVTVGFYQYNGVKWARVNTVEDNYRKATAPASASYVVSTGDHTIVYSGSNAADTIDQPLAADNAARILKVVNQSANDINFTINYVSLDGTSVSTIPANSIVEIQSDGANWNRTN